MTAVDIMQILLIKDLNQAKAKKDDLVEYLEGMMWRRCRETEDIAIHGSHNKIEVISTINIVSQDHAVSVNKSREKKMSKYVFLKDLILLKEYRRKKK